MKVFVVISLLSATGAFAQAPLQQEVIHQEALKKRSEFKGAVWGTHEDTPTTLLKPTDVAPDRLQLYFSPERKLEFRLTQHQASKPDRTQVESMDIGTLHHLLGRVWTEKKYLETEYGIDRLPSKCACQIPMNTAEKLREKYDQLIAIERLIRMRGDTTPLKSGFSSLSLFQLVEELRLRLSTNSPSHIDFKIANEDPEGVKTLKEKKVAAVNLGSPVTAQVSDLAIDRPLIDPFATGEEDTGPKPGVFKAQN